jgi:hypothetical protein
VIKLTQEYPTAEKQNRQKMPVFTCSCGTNILIVPDLKEMDKAIKHHETEHKRLTGKLITQEYVTQQILKALSEHFV